MTPKAQQLDTYDVPNDSKLEFVEKKTNHQRNLSSGSDILANINTDSNSSTSLLLNSLSNRVTSVISPTVIVLVATPIALQYPLIQLIMFLTILVGTSPLYFIMITFIGQSNKHNNLYKQNPQQQSHRRQPSIVGSIADMKDEASKSK